MTQKRLKQTKLREETRTSIFSKLGNALGMTTETRSKSILYNSRIKSLFCEMSNAKKCMT